MTVYYDGKNFSFFTAGTFSVKQKFYVTDWPDHPPLPSILHHIAGTRVPARLYALTPQDCKTTQRETKQSSGPLSVCKRCSHCKLFSSSGIWTAATRRPTYPVTSARQRSTCPAQTMTAMGLFGSRQSLRGTDAFRLVLLWLSAQSHLSQSRAAAAPHPRKECRAGSSPGNHAALLRVLSHLFFLVFLSPFFNCSQGNVLKWKFLPPLGLSCPLWACPTAPTVCVR